MFSIHILRQPPLTIKNGKAANPQAVIGEAISRSTPQSHGGEIKTKNMKPVRRAHAPTPCTPYRSGATSWRPSTIGALDQGAVVSIRIVRRIDTQHAPDELAGARSFHSINDRKSGDGRASSIDRRNVLASGGSRDCVLLQEAGAETCKGWLRRATARSSKCARLLSSARASSWQ